ALLDGQLVVWGESPRDATAASAAEPASKTKGARPRKGRQPTGAAKPVTTAAAPLPYDAGASRLAEALSQAVAGLPARPQDAATYLAWLPTQSGQPVPSSPLVAEPPSAPHDQEPGKAETVIAPWSVSGLALPPESALDLLCAAMGRTTLVPGVVVG